MKNKNLISVSGRLGHGKDEVGKIIQYLTSKETGPYTAWLNAQKAHGTDPTITYQVKKFAGKLKEIVCLLTGCTLEELESQEFKNKELGEEWIIKHKNWISEKELELYAGGAGKTLEQYLAQNEHEFLGEDDGLKFYRAKYLDKNYTYRELLQKVGTDALRNVIHEDIHVNALFADYLSPVEYAIKNTGGYSNCDYPFNFPKWIITDMRFLNEKAAVEKRGGITIRVNRPVLPAETHLIKTGSIIEHPSETALDSAEFDHIIDNSFDIEGLVAQVKNILQMEDII
jgi:hypothetical protein